MPRSFYPPSPGDKPVVEKRTGWVVVTKRKKKETDYYRPPVVKQLKTKQQDNITPLNDNGKDKMQSMQSPSSCGAI